MAQKGNKNGVKLKDPDVRQEAYDQYCAWLARGKSPDSFVFRKGALTCIGETIQSYIDNNPLEFPAIKAKAAIAEGLQIWEQHCEDSAIGTNKDANTASLQMVMRNKYKWDAKKEKSLEEEAKEKAPLDRFVQAMDKAREADNIIDPLAP